MASSSTQKKKRGSKRGPYRCTICPGRPVRTGCLHGKEKHGAKKVATSNLQAEESSIVGGNGTSAQVPQLGVIDASLSIANAQEPFTPAAPALLPGLENAPLLEMTFPSAVNHAPKVAVSDNFHSVGASNEDSTLGDESGNFLDAEVSCDESPSRTPRKPAISLSNPVFGTVEGAGRGNQLLQIPRARSLRPPMVDQAKSTLRYTRLIKDLICRAEAVSHETGCWLHLAAQHPSSSSPFVHFSSRRLRKEAEPELKEIHQLFSKVMGALVRSGKRAKMEASMQVAKAEEKLHSAEANLQQAKSDLAEKDRIIAALMERSRLLNE